MIAADGHVRCMCQLLVFKSPPTSQGVAQVPVSHLIVSVLTPFVKGCASEDRTGASSPSTFMCARRHL